MLPTETGADNLSLGFKAMTGIGEPANMRLWFLAHIRSDTAGDATIGL
ncbi:hypothetical protein HM1_0214 [Heliomicrobium modesticaldum Ice1]|uniref:Uncharacterized protein n=1 Tax=Heliobacterium modesticaldum (strain ATCC 51547 / Ice1) TaxID=498761 RepID=B0TDX0_HELMI|nr:hypothetical protein HM1_0214 [Heliomicrobium modesticaldum Ice1]